MRRTLFLIALLVSFTAFSTLTPVADARPDTPTSCNDIVNDDGSCPGGVCVWPTPSSAGACTKPSPVKVCTANHAPCGWSDVACASTSKAQECVTFVCACMPMSSTPAALTLPQPISPSTCTGCAPWICAEGVNAKECWGADGRHDVCMGYSLQVPFCTDIPCQDCFTINCTTLRPACDPTHPCSWGWFECVPCECPPMAWSVDVPPTPVPVGNSCANCVPVAVCTNLQHDATKCGGYDVCVYGYNWKPVCHDVPCGDLTCVDIPAPCDGKYFECTCDICDFSANPEFGPLVGVCIAGVTSADCYGDHDVCVGMSYQVPFCVDLPGIACGQLVCGPHPVPVTVCAKENACDQGHDVCIQYGMTPPACQDFPECACMPMSGPSVPPPCACPPLQAHSAQCTAVVGSGAAAAACVVDGETYGPVRTCDTCAVLFQVVCTAGTEGVRCW